MADKRGMVIQRGFHAAHADAYQHIGFQHWHGGETRFNLRPRRRAQGGVENRAADRVVNPKALLDGGIGQAKLEADNIAEWLGENRHQLFLHAAPIGRRQRGEGRWRLALQYLPCKTRNRRIIRAGSLGAWRQRQAEQQRRAKAPQHHGRTCPVPKIL